MTPSPLVRLVVLLLCSTVAVAQAPAPSSQRITPNFQNVDIMVVAEAVGSATGVTFIPDPRVRAQVTLISPQPMTPAQLYQTFLSILQVNNFAATRSGNVVKIVPDAQVRTMPGNDLPATVNAGSDEMVTTVIESKNVNANQLSAVLRPLIAQYGNLAPVPGTNLLVITDRAANVARMQRLVERFDQASSTGLQVIRLENSNAADVVRTLNALLAGQPADAGSGLAPKIAADDRSNSVLVSGEPSVRLRVASWIEYLDAPVASSGGIEVVRLKYQDAEKLAAKLKEQTTGIAAATGAAPAAGAAGAGGVDRSTSIVAEKQTNSLIITAPPKMMRELKALVEKLDIPRAQVLVEAIIADVSTDKSADLGVNWAVFSNEDGTSVPAGGFISPVGSANGNPFSIVDLTRAVRDPASATSVPLGATFALGRLRDSGLNFGAMIRALRADGNTNVIATPRLIATENQESQFESAQEVPFITGQYTNTSGNNNGTVNPFTTVSRQKVGTILKMTPQFNGDKMLTLTLELESSELAGATGDAGSAITNTRSFKTTVLVEDGATIVVGGMIRDSKLTGETRVPFLGRIPLIGEAFKVRNGRRAQSNLMVFISPKILHDSVQAGVETSTAYERLREIQRQQNDKRELIPILPLDRPPTLPPMPPNGSRLPDPPSPNATTSPVPDAGGGRP